jgi:c-di-GMP-binding flagellar brake protein YcgR
MIERRRYFRLKDGVSLDYTLSGGGNNPSGSAAIDVGGGGVCFNTPERILPGTSLEVNLKLPEDQEKFSALARVAWQKPEPKKDKSGKVSYETGIEFLKMNLKDRLQIIHYVYAKVKQQGK